MSNTQITQFDTAVAAFQAWDAAIDAYLVDANDDNSLTERVTSDRFQQTFTQLCTERGIYRIAKPCHMAERHLWDQVARTAVPS